MIPLNPDEEIICVGSEPFDNFDEAENFRKAINMKIGGSTRKPTKRKRKRRGPKAPSVEVPEELLDLDFSPRDEDEDEDEEESIDNVFSNDDDLAAFF